MDIGDTQISAGDMSKAAGAGANLARNVPGMTGQTTQQGKL